MLSPVHSRAKIILSVLPDIIAFILYADAIRRTQNWYILNPMLFGKQDCLQSTSSVLCNMLMGKLKANFIATTNLEGTREMKRLALLFL